MKSFDFDKQGFIIDGKREFLIGGEIAHFRVPKEEWHNRMQLFKKAGGNAITTSIPWVLHEENEGELLFNDVDFRNLEEFLRAAKQEDLFVYVRPGPYVYTEIKNGGIPEWIYQKYPNVKLKRADGSTIEQLSYLHPVAIEKFKNFYKRVATEIKPFLITNGGTVAMVQLDNELAGIHTWNGTIDYNEETMGFGTEDGLYVTYIKNLYQSIENLNKAYGTAYSSFKEVDPRKFEFSGNYRARAEKDYHDFYCYSLALYARTLFIELRNNGIDVPVTANAANAYLLNYLKELTEEFKDEKFFIGFDNYYNLDINWADFNPNPKWFLRNVYTADAMKDMGFPYVVLEMQAGSYADIPPVMSEDLYAWYMMNFALGMKGVSYYIFAGGENPKNSGITTDVYDFQAPVSYDGKCRASYYALQKFNLFMKKQRWLLTAQRVSSVQVGFEYQSMRGNAYTNFANLKNALATEDRLYKCLAFSLFSSAYSFEFKCLQSELDITRPLLIMSPETMSEKAQQNVVEFIEKGGNVFILGTLPTINDSFEPCTILKDYIGETEEVKNTSKNPVTLINGDRVYYVFCENAFAKIPENAEVFATDGDKEFVLGFNLNKGKGKVFVLNGWWLTQNMGQVEMLEKILTKLNAKSYVYSSNRSVYTTLLSNGKEKAVFVINLYTGEQSTVISVNINGKIKRLGKMKLKPMQVKMIRI